MKQSFQALLVLLFSVAAALAQTTPTFTETKSNVKVGREELEVTSTAKCPEGSTIVELSSCRSFSAPSATLVDSGVDSEENAASCKYKREAKTSVLLTQLSVTTTIKCSWDGPDEFGFGPHAVDQCTNPVTTIRNRYTSGSGATPHMQIPPKQSDGTCKSPDLGYCIGDCVRVEVKTDDGKTTRAVNVRAGHSLPNPGNCSPIALWTNAPPRWDFTHNGYCGQGKSGVGAWHNCLVHDVCVWARCTDDGMKAGAPAGAADDRVCGKSYTQAEIQWKWANVAPRNLCINDNGCDRSGGWDCIMGSCRVEGLSHGSGCRNDSDCRGYCQRRHLGDLFPICQTGNRHDLCEKDEHCQRTNTARTCKKGFARVVGRCE